MSIKILHNPRCSKSRQTLELIRQQGIEPDVREYLKEPLTATELNELVKLLGVDTRALIRTKEEEFKATGLTPESASDEELIKALVETPKLMERPVVITPKGARIGRPPELVLEIL